MRQDRSNEIIEVINVCSGLLEFRDENTGDHVRRVGLLSGKLAAKAGIEDAHLIQTAAPLHDAGKVGVVNGILFKPRGLNPGEYEAMKQHTLIGYGALSRANSPVLQVAARIALTHHERWDGSGYPKGLAGVQIPIEGRVVALADAWDAMRSDRPYRRKLWEPEAAKRIRQAKGRQFDPDLTDAFIALIEANEVS